MSIGEDEEDVLAFECSEPLWTVAVFDELDSSSLIAGDLVLAELEGDKSEAELLALSTNVLLVFAVKLD